MTLETLLGLNDDPALLDRYGPVPAALARDLATNGTFRCAAVDDTHGTILGLGHATYRDSYRPGPRLIDLTRTTYRRCSFPGCRTRALAPTGNADLDHATPWPHGPTCSCNLHAFGEYPTNGVTGRMADVCRPGRSSDGRNDPRNDDSGEEHQQDYR
jgi:hypothetical protein